MPVILQPDTYSAWLIPDETPYEKLKPLLKPYDHSLMSALPSFQVGK